MWKFPLIFLWAEFFREWSFAREEGLQTVESSHTNIQKISTEQLYRLSITWWLAPQRSMIMIVCKLFFSAASINKFRPSSLFSCISLICFWWFTVIGWSAIMATLFIAVKKYRASPNASLAAIVIGGLLSILEFANLISDSLRASLVNSLVISKSSLCSPNRFDCKAPINNLKLAFSSASNSGRVLVLLPIRFLQSACCRHFWRRVSLSFLQVTWTMNDRDSPFRRILHWSIV